MAHVFVEDEDGFKLEMLQLDNGRYAGGIFKAATLNNTKSIKLRDDDILFCSYAKSGCHWIWQNLRFLQEGRIVQDDVDKESCMIGLLDLNTIDRLPSPRLLNTHVFFDMLPPDVLKGKVKVVQVYRNPKDIAVSFFYHHKRLRYYAYQGEFSNYVKRFAKGLVSNNNVFDYWQGWEEGLNANPQIPCHICSFEDFKKNPIRERRRLAQFLGRSYSDEFLKEVEAATDIGVMKQLKGNVKDNQGAPVFYRKGEIGDWKNHFTVQESEWFDGITQSRMGDSKLFKFVYS